MLARKIYVLIRRLAVKLGARNPVAGASEVGDELIHGNASGETVIHDWIVQAACRDAAIVGADTGEIGGDGWIVGGARFGGCVRALHLPRIATRGAADDSRPRFGALARASAGWFVELTAVTKVALVVDGSRFR